MEPTPINDLLCVVNSSEVPRRFQEDTPQMSLKELRVVAINILTWLQRQKRFGHEKPLRLRHGHAWCQNARKLLMKSEPLGSIFEISNDTIQFKESVGEADRYELRKLAEEHYRPILRSRCQTEKKEE